MTQNRPSARTVASPRAAATVAIAQGGARGPELLLVQRSSRLQFMPGVWVFPGGAVDDCDVTAGGEEAGGDAAGRRAAVREAAEEAGVRLCPSRMMPWSHWTTPDTSPRQFATRFYVAFDSRGRVRVDGGEIVDHVWLTSHEALGYHAEGALRLTGPTFVTLVELLHFVELGALKSRGARRAVERYRPRVVATTSGLRVSLFEQDAGWAARDLDVPGPHHRLTALATGHRYERSPDARYALTYRS